MEKGRFVEVMQKDGYPEHIIEELWEGLPEIAHLLSDERLEEHIRETNIQMDDELQDLKRLRRILYN